MEKPSPSENQPSRQDKPAKPVESCREAELVGGMKNALERGEPLKKIKQSFLNAGYKSSEINSAAMKLSTTQTQNRAVQQSPQTTTYQKQSSQPQQPQQNQTQQQKKSFFSKIFSIFKKNKTAQEPTPQQSQAAPSQPQQLQYQNQQKPKQKFSKTWIIIMIIVSALILIVAAVLGLYWEVLF